MERDQERADRQREHARSGQRSLRLEPVYQSACRCLRCDAADRERNADALLVPAVCGKVYSEERPNAGLHVGQQEGEPESSPGRLLLEGSLSRSESELATVVLSFASEPIPEAVGGRRVIRGTLQVQHRASPHSLGAGQHSFPLIVPFLNAERRRRLGRGLPRRTFKPTLQAEAADKIAAVLIGSVGS